MQVMESMRVHKKLSSCREMYFAAAGQLAKRLGHELRRQLFVFLDGVRSVEVTEHAREVANLGRRDRYGPKGSARRFGRKRSPSQPMELVAIIGRHPAPPLLYADSPF